MGGAFGYLGPWRPPRARLLERWLAQRELARRQRRGWPLGLQAARLRPRTRHGLGAGEHALPAPAGQRGRGRAGRPVRQRHERRHSAPALHAAHRQQHVRQPCKQPRLLTVRLPQSNNTPRPFSWGLNPVALPQSQSSRASSSSGQSRRSLPPPSFDQLARDIEAA